MIRAHLEEWEYSPLKEEISKVIQFGTGMINGMPHIANIDGSYRGGVDLWYEGSFLGVSQMRGSKLCIRKNCPRPHYHPRVYEYDYYFASWLGERVARLMIKRSLSVFCLIGKRDFLTMSQKSINPRCISMSKSTDECFERELIEEFYGTISREFFKGQRERYACYEDNYTFAPSIEVIKLDPRNHDSPACVTFINTLPAGLCEEKRQAVQAMAVAYGESLLSEKMRLST